VMLILPFGLTSCLDGSDTVTPEETLAKQTAQIDEYLTTNHINAVKDPSGVRMAISVLGTGLPALTSNKVDVDYDGKVFGSTSSFDQGNVKGLLSGYIYGWQIALGTLPAGSKASVFIPAYWGYKDQPQGPIPANSILVFDLTFNEIIETSAEIQKLTADTVAIDNYLTAKSIDAIKDTTGIRYVVHELGTGPIPSWYDRIIVEYSYKLLTDDSKVIYEGTSEPGDLAYNRVVDFMHSMKVGLQKLPEGSQATIYSPSGLAFGTQQRTDQSGQVVIPANSNLIIEVKLVDVIDQ